MIYTSYEDLANTIRKNLWKIPQDINLIVGIPRSGMIPALMIAEFLNIPITDIDSFVDDKILSCGGRGRLIKNKNKQKVLILDDTVYSGGAMQIAKDKTESLKQKYDILYGCIYAEGKNAKDKVDLYFEENYLPGGDNIYFYEWNILHHYEKKTKIMMWDMDGIICKDPPDDSNAEEYEKYIKAAIPIIIPTTKIGAICTYRLEKYRDVTEKWLHKYNIDVGQLIMFKAKTREERNKICSPGYYKGKIYKEATWAQLFLESDAHQAEKIHNISGKPVFCYANGKMYK